MGKTPKKPAPGGDESNLYVRRLKATTTSSLKVSDTSLTARQRELENPNRGKPIGVQKRLPVPAGKVFKSKIRSPSTGKSHKPLKNPPGFQPSTSKDEKKPTEQPSTISKDSETITAEVPTMYPETEEAAVQSKVSITKKDVKDGGRSSSDEGNNAKEKTEEVSEIHASSNGKNAKDIKETENITPRHEGGKEGSAGDKNSSDKQQTSEEKTSETWDNGNESSDTIKNDSRHEENQPENRSSELEDNSLKLEDEEETQKRSENNSDSPELTKNIQEGKEEAVPKETIVSSEVKNIADSGSVDIVESTTSEISDSGNATQSDKAPENDEAKDNLEDDASFVSYDSSIMLKDVQIKLNDCLKDNSKLFEVSNANDESIDTDPADQQKRLEMSFGKTLRNISGRSTINRLRYVTVREQRFSPNSSLFVNTSSASLDPEESVSSKILRHSSAMSDALSTNGSPAERKRKIVTETDVTVKKLKTETPERTSILNTSLELLKGIRRPIQVSTPNTKGYKFTIDKCNEKAFADEKLTVEVEAEPRKWCVIM